MNPQNSTSGAYFNFLQKRDGTFIRKCFNGDPSKLKFQFEWILRHQGLSCIPYVENPVFDWNYFSYDLRFYHDHRSFFEIIKEGDLYRCQKILEKILNLLPHIHTNKKVLISYENLGHYLEEKFFRKVEYCENLYPTLKYFNRHDTVIVNGKELLGFSQIREKILDTKILKQLSQYTETEIHGDLTAENILIGPNDDLILLDPNNENYISSPLVDYSKLLQSLNSRYELLCLVEKVEISNHCLYFQVEENLVIDSLLKFFGEKMQHLFFPDERRHLVFHEAMHLARLLPYRLKVNEHSFMAFYAMMLVRFNEFLDAESL